MKISGVVESANALPVQVKGCSSFMQYSYRYDGPVGNTSESSPDRRNRIVALHGIHELLAQCTDEDMKQTVKKIADELRFSDPVSSNATVELEEELKNQMADIQQAVADGDASSAKMLCEKLLSSLAERNRICSISK